MKTNQKYNKKILSADELLELIISKQWANIEDIILISGKGRTRAKSDKKEIEEELKKKKYKIPRGFVPMETVVDFYKINISYLKKITNLKK